MVENVTFAVTQSMDATVWRTFHVVDNNGANLWVGEVVPTGVSYRNTPVDFQMIIPEDGTGGNTASTTFNMWVELI